MNFGIFRLVGVGVGLEPIPGWQLKLGESQSYTQILDWKGVSALTAALFKGQLNKLPFHNAFLQKFKTF